MNVTQKLMDEHQLILKYIDLLAQYCDRAQAQGDVSILNSKLGTFVDFIVSFADAYHHGKEEDVLFAYLGKPGVLTHCNPVQQMLHEHDLGRKFLQGMKQAGEQAALTALVENARAYGELLSQHIQKEDRILYRMAEQSLSDQQKGEILEAYQRAEEKFGGAALQARFEKEFNALMSSL